jgi:endonuclease/exonuclease/phosphatase (EEP) superfamily protein YafD
VNWLLSFVLTAAALPPLAARALGGGPPNPGPKLAAFAPLATVPSIAAVLLAASVRWWLAIVVAAPAAALLSWQIFPPCRTTKDYSRRKQATSECRERSLRVLTLNARRGAADIAEIMSCLRKWRIDVLAIQELTPDMAECLVEGGIAKLLPFHDVHPVAGSRGAGLWARWPLIPLPPLAGLTAATPQVRVCHKLGRSILITNVHPVAPVGGHEFRWQRELAIIQAVLANSEHPQVVVGDFNASRDHRAFRRLLSAGFCDCADAAQARSWPGFTWPVRRGVRPLMRLDHVLVSEGYAQIREARTLTIQGTDHCAVLAIITFQTA